MCSKQLNTVLRIPSLWSCSVCLDQNSDESKDAFAQVPWSPAPAPSPMNPIDCRSACASRCALSSRPNLCNRACGSCCARCNCVPPGTSGNYHMCPCYAAITTRGGRPKCP
ncbi:hypothetical protein PAHAL_7G335800 [Panicum hallii]|uniref:Uncharacterized protein n=1 Tax=Panicum hallii TaxID=206008 RepID=A0A2S3ICA5_9POAL|nr:hypothetical protein PAHAL_7G335800 [Panicum hallii]